MSKGYQIGQHVTPKRDEWQYTKPGVAYEIIAVEAWRTSDAFRPARDWQAICIRDNRGTATWYNSTHFRNAKRLVKAQRKMAQRPWHVCGADRGHMAQWQNEAIAVLHEALHVYRFHGRRTFKSHASAVRDTLAIAAISRVAAMRNGFHL